MNGGKQRYSYDDDEEVDELEYYGYDQAYGSDANYYYSEPKSYYSDDEDDYSSEDEETESEGMDDEYESDEEALYEREVYPS